MSKLYIYLFLHVQWFVFKKPIVVSLSQVCHRALSWTHQATVSENT
jgi:hypothetical protein